MPVDAMSTHNYRIGEEVRCVIHGIFPFGVFVRLENDSPGYIRLRDLSLEGDARGLAGLDIGQQISAVVTELPGENNRFLLSHRATLQDPWEQFVLSHRQGDLVTGTVRGLSKNDVTVEIEPGVRGSIALSELASWPVKEPKDIFWIDDQVQAIIVHLQRRPPRMLLSVRRLLARTAFTTAVLQRLNQQNEASAIQPDLPAAVPRVTLQLPGPLLLVDDTKELCEQLARTLSDFGCAVTAVASGVQALEIAQKTPHALIIADLDMPDLNGIELIVRLRAEGYALPIAVMSDPSFIVENMPRLLELNIAAALPKPLEMDEVQALLQQLERGEQPHLNPVDWVSTQQSTEFRQPATLAVEGEGPIEARLQKVLEDAVRDTGATQGVIFRLDPISLEIEINASAPSMHIAPELVYGLRESPVKDVIVEDQSLVEGNILGNPVQRRRFANLLPLLSFESCLAIPLRGGGQVERALFLFHQTPGVFNIYRQRDARAAATLMSALLENEAAERQMRALGGLLLSGQLAAGFGHEVHNKLAILNLQFDNLRSQLEQRLDPAATETSTDTATGVTAALNAATAASLELQRTVRDFRKLMGPRERELIDVNEVIRQAEALMRPIARRSQVNFRLELVPDLPGVVGSSLGLQQVILNLLLNATEHTGAKKDPGRLVTVTTLCTATATESNTAGRQVEIRVADTGPGIHRRLWNKIFELGFTTRGSEGSGLGLFIARSLLNSMRGMIHVENSYVPVGATFLIELPAAA